MGTPGPTSFNPLRRECAVWLEPGPEYNPVGQAMDIEEMVDACLTAGDSGADVTADDVWEGMGWGPPGSWEPNLPVTSTDFPGLSVLPSGIPEPTTPAADLPYTDGTGYRIELTDREYSAQRIAEIDAWRDTTTTDDDLITIYEWDSWDSTHMGMQLLAQELRTDLGTVANRRERSNFADFDTPQTVIQRAGSSARTWTYSYDRGTRSGPFDGYAPIAIFGR